MAKKVNSDLSETLLIRTRSTRKARLHRRKKLNWKCLFARSWQALIKSNLSGGNCFTIMLFAVLIKDSSVGISFDTVVVVDNRSMFHSMTKWSTSSLKGNLSWVTVTFFRDWTHYIKTKDIHFEARQRLILWNLDLQVVRSGQMTCWPKAWPVKFTRESKTV